MKCDRDEKRRNWLCIILYGYQTKQSKSLQLNETKKNTIKKKKTEKKNTIKKKKHNKKGLIILHVNNIRRRSIGTRREHRSIVIVHRERRIILIHWISVHRERRIILVIFIFVLVHSKILLNERFSNMIKGIISKLKLSQLIITTTLNKLINVVIHFPNALIDVRFTNLVRQTTEKTIYIENTRQRLKNHLHQTNFGLI